MIEAYSVSPEDVRRLVDELLRLGHRLPEHIRQSIGTLIASTCDQEY